MTMNFANLSDVDTALHGVAELRGLLAGLGTYIGSMTSVLNAREQSLRDCRHELVARQ